MDDFNVNCLYECRNELGARLLNTLNPCIVDGFKSILEESVNVCKENKEMNKYLITFQNLIGRVPKWNKHIIEEERKRIIAKTGIDYLETLVNGVHVCVVKILTAVRSSQKQKKIDIDIPVIDDFIHKVYVISARKIYKNVYLFEKDIPPLQIQKNNRELEIIINECILNALRESVSTETLLKVYMDDEDVVEDIKQEIIMPVNEEQEPEQSVNEEEEKEKEDDKIPIPIEKEEEQTTQSEVIPDLSSSLTFNDVDFTKGVDGGEEEVVAPKTIERLDEISEMRNNQRKIYEQEQDDDYDEDAPVKLKIFDDITADVSDLPDLLNDIEIID